MPSHLLQRLAAAARDTIRVYWPLWLALTLMLSTLPPILAILNGTLWKTLALLTVCRSTVYAWPLVFLAALTGRRSVTYIIAATVAVCSLCCALFPILSGQLMNDATFVMLVEADSREVAGFVDKYITGQRIATAGAYLVFIGAAVYAAGLKATLSRRATAIAAIVAGTFAATGIVRIGHLYSIFGGCNQNIADIRIASEDRLTRLPNIINIFGGDIGTATIATAYRLHRTSSDLHRWEETQRTALRQTYGRAGRADSINVVVIIGESFVKRHSSLYGYRLNTNPKLAALADSGRLTTFADIITVGNYTNDAVRNIYNLNSTGKGEPWHAAAAFPVVAARSGWRVHLYDNQIDGVAQLFDVELAGILLNPIMKSEVYEWATDSIDRYDGDFVARVNRRFPFDGSVGNMDIYHLYGQHFEPRERYPSGAGFDVWNADSICADKAVGADRRRRQTIAEYDNATLYNDAVTATIIDRYKGTPTVFIYFPDHGEEIYDFAPTVERIITPTTEYLADWLRTEFEIPFFVAFTPEYATLMPLSCQSIGNAAHRPGSTDNIGHMVLGLGGATDNPYYRADRDILAPAYRCPRRMTSWGIDYDAIIKNDTRAK